MFDLVFHWVLNWFFGWAGLSVFVALGAAAAWWFLPAIFVKAKALAFNVAIGALAFNFIYTMGFQNGAATTKSAWDAAEVRAIERGSDARQEAEREIPPAEPDPAPVCPPVPGTVDPVKPAPRAVPQWMRNDRNNRDSH